MKLKGEKNHMYQKEGKTYDLGSYKVEVLKDWSFLILLKRETQQPVDKRIHTIADKEMVLIKALPDDFMSPESLQDLKPDATAAQNGNPIPGGFTMR